MINRIILFILISFVSLSTAFGATEDFTTYSTNNEGGSCTLTNTAGQAQTSGSCYRYRDFRTYKSYGADYFGNYTIEFVANVDNVNSWTSLTPFAISNQADCTKIKGLDTANLGVSLYGYRNGSSQYYWILKNWDGDTTETSVTRSNNTDYWVRIVQTSTNVVATIWTDTWDGTLFDTLTVDSNDTSYEYIGVQCSEDSGASSEVHRGETYDLTIVEADAGGGSSRRRMSTILVN